MLEKTAQIQIEFINFLKSQDIDLLDVDLSSPSIHFFSVGYSANDDRLITPAGYVTSNNLNKSEPTKFFSIQAPSKLTPEELNTQSFELLEKMLHEQLHAQSLNELFTDPEFNIQSDERSCLEMCTQTFVRSKLFEYGKASGFIKSDEEFRQYMQSTTAYREELSLFLALEKSNPNLGELIINGGFTQDFKTVLREINNFLKKDNLDILIDNLKSDLWLNDEAISELRNAFELGNLDYAYLKQIFINSASEYRGMGFPTTRSVARGMFNKINNVDPDFIPEDMNFKNFLTKINEDSGFKNRVWQLCA